MLAEQSPIDPTVPGYYDKIDIDSLILGQIQRCLVAQANPDTVLFERCVEGLRSLLRSDRRKQAQEYGDQTCLSRMETLQYKYWCGVPMGSPSKPHMINGEVVSPIMISEEYMNYNLLFDFIMGLLEADAVTWKTKEKYTHSGLDIPTKPTPPLVEEESPPVEEHIYTRWQPEPEQPVPVVNDEDVPEEVVEDTLEDIPDEEHKKIW